MVKGVATSIITIAVFIGSLVAFSHLVSKSAASEKTATPIEVQMRIEVQKEISSNNFVLEAGKRYSWELWLSQLPVEYETITVILEASDSRISFFGSLKEELEWEGSEFQFVRIKKAVNIFVEPDTPDGTIGTVTVTAQTTDTENGVYVPSELREVTFQISNLGPGVLGASMEGPDWCQLFPMTQIHGSTKEDASDWINIRGPESGLSLNDINWAYAYDDVVPEGSVIRHNDSDCDNIIVEISLGPYSDSESATPSENATPTPQTLVVENPTPDSSAIVDPDTETGDKSGKRFLNIPWYWLIPIGLSILFILQVLGSGYRKNKL